MPKESKNGVRRSEIEPQPQKQEHPRAQTNGVRRVSDPSSVGTVATTSRLREVFSTTETVVASTISPPANDHVDPGDIQVPPPQVVQSIPRPPSTVSTCQCYPPSVTLHVVLQHNPFDRYIIHWDVSLSPTTQLYWGHRPEEILSNQRTIKYPDFFDEYATNPPVRHMFINALGDFPLARCQGDPDPARSKNRERHMYSTGHGDEQVEMRTLPWPIRITGTSEGNGYVTLKDVFRGIYKNFQLYIHKEEYELYTIERKRVIGAAYHLRQKLLEEARAWPPFPNIIGWGRPSYSEDWIEEGIMRCDYLGTQLIFRGLEVSPDREGYTLFLGPV